MNSQKASETSERANLYDEYRKEAVAGTLSVLGPPDFSQWALADNRGWTVAHAAANANKLPSDFSQWDLADKSGWTVAHEAVRHGQQLPPSSFSQWPMADDRGILVAHVAALYGSLPDDFDRWGAESTGSVGGESVLCYLSTSDRINRFITIWEMERPLCATAEDWEVFKIVLPGVYSKYAIIESMESRTLDWADGNLL
jgi:hypothetical protein